MESSLIWTPELLAYWQAFSAAVLEVRPGWTPQKRTYELFHRILSANPSEASAMVAGVPLLKPGKSVYYFLADQAYKQVVKIEKPREEMTYAERNFRRN